MDTVLARYGHLLTSEELAGLVAFAQLPLRCQQLYARLLGRKWPQWVPREGLGARYRELGEGEAAEAAAELASGGPPCAAAEASPPGGLDSWEALRAAAPPGAPPPWLLDTASETAASLLGRPLEQPGQPGASYASLLLSALPAPELRRLARGLGLDAAGAEPGRKGRGAGAAGAGAEPGRSQIQMTNNKE